MYGISTFSIIKPTILFSLPPSLPPSLSLSLPLFLSLLPGIILSHLHYSSERIRAASLLSPVIVDPENVYVHVLPFIAFETPLIRQQIIDNIVSWLISKLMVQFYLIIIIFFILQLQLLACCVAGSSLLGIYCIVGNFWGRKLSPISKKWPFRGEIFRGTLKLIIGGHGTPQILWRIKTFAGGSKTTKFVNV